MGITANLIKSKSTSSNACPLNRSKSKRLVSVSCDQKSLVIKKTILDKLFTSIYLENIILSKLNSN